VEIHPVESFKMPENCFLFPIEGNKHNSFSIQLPLQIKCADGDTLTLNHMYLVDTGMAWDVAIMYLAEELEFFRKRDDAVRITSKMGQNLCYTIVSAMLSDYFVMDSLRIYTFNNPNSVDSHYLIGQHFLKRFNVFFDMKNRQLGLQPIKNFQRIVNPNYHQFHYWAPPTPEGKYIVKIIATNNNNYYKTAGLQIEDEVVAINNIPYKDITYEQTIEHDTLLLDIIRDGKPIQLVVPVDKNEEQGD
jgi:hypothetical protein